MHLAVLEKGKVIKGVLCNEGVVIHHAIGIDGDTFLFSGDIKEVEEKASLLKGMSSILQIPCNDIKVLPLYRKLSSKDCMDIIYIANNYTRSGFVKGLSEVFESDKLDNWLCCEKEKRNFKRG